MIYRKVSTKPLVEKALGVQSDLLSWSHIQLKNLKFGSCAKCMQCSDFVFDQLPFEFVQRAKLEKM